MRLVIDKVLLAGMYTITIAIVYMMMMYYTGAQSNLSSSVAVSGIIIIIVFYAFVIKVSIEDDRKDDKVESWI